MLPLHITTNIKLLLMKFKLSMNLIPTSVKLTVNWLRIISNTLKVRFS